MNVKQEIEQLQIEIAVGKKKLNKFLVAKEKVEQRLRTYITSREEKMHQLMENKKESKQNDDFIEEEIVPVEESFT